MVGDFIIGVVMDVLGHVRVKILELLGVDWIPASPGNFAVLDSSEFVVLGPKVGSRISAAAANLSRAASPWVRLLYSSPSCAKTDNRLAKSPLPMVAVPAAANPLLMNERRPVPLVKPFRVSFILNNARR